MKNFLEYFYNIKIDNINKHNNFYEFIYQRNKYKLYINEFIPNPTLTYNISKSLKYNSLISEIILNKDNNIITTYNNNYYILLKLSINETKKITLKEISNLANKLYVENLNINWGLLWSNKIDYLEELINENGKKYPIIVDSFNYFVGLAENAISYYENVKTENNYKYVISHKKININDTIEAIYNPFNIIFDYRVRDIAEYIKISFWNNLDIYKELDNYLINNYLTINEVNLLISRLLYPSFYFNMYEDIIINKKDEKILLNIINKTKEYESYLNNIISYFKKYYPCEEIEWLKKNED